MLALVGESGSGKSVTSLALMRLTPPAPRTELTGSALFRGRDGVTRNLLALSETDMQGMRGNEISMIFQEPMTSLNPVQTVGMQIAEAIIYHRGMGRRPALDEPSGCWSSSASRKRDGGFQSIRITFRAACANGS